jgi:hypothetical protein
MICLVSCPMTVASATLAPDAALRFNVRRSVRGPVADIVVHNRGALMALVGATLSPQRASRRRGPGLTVAAASRAVSSRWRSRTVDASWRPGGIAVSMEVLCAIVFASCLP